MGELDRFRAVLTEVRDAVDAIEDPFARSGVRLAADVVWNSLGEPGAPVTSALVNDIAFAFNDLALAGDDLSDSDAIEVGPRLSVLRSEIDRLREATALPRDVIHAMRALQGKLKIRRTAIERQTFVEGGATPLPHAPEELRGDALPLQRRLADAGFATPALDQLIDDPSSLRFATIGEVIDELDAIAGE